MTPSLRNLGFHFTNPHSTLISLIFHANPYNSFKSTQITHTEAQQRALSVHFPLKSPSGPPNLCIQGPTGLPSQIAGRFSFFFSFSFSSGGPGRLRVFSSDIFFQSSRTASLYFSLFIFQVCRYRSSFFFHMNSYLSWYAAAYFFLPSISLGLVAAAYFFSYQYNFIVFNI